MQCLDKKTYLKATAYVRKSKNEQKLMTSVEKYVDLK